MSYASILVAVDDGQHAPARVSLAAELAHRLGARLVGVAACMPDYPRGFGETAVPMGMVIEEIRQAVLDRLAGVEQVFRDASCQNERTEWRSDLASPVPFLEGQSRAADLVVVGRYADDEGVTTGMAVEVGDALMGVGRPVLVVPAGVEHVEAQRIVVGWKNTPQTRRAVSDALPLLRRAEAVQVFRVSDGEDRAEVEDVTRYLALHDVNATAQLVKPSGWTVADDVRKAAVDFDADLIVTGAYGYSRLREWFFGGVTRDLLAKAPICCLLSH
ncbi:universal stress protein [Methylobacterium sp. PvR107]|uniref:universal stress protein n=1 Tax=Methylobacterium sp. PvR107 TaxID=2806597 RepID=UPI001AE22387|nr:universal stress protein [Methylobacterium sp. PvR107]MBP1179885.1 nucleotide-binding universal stress UspA family protein [Methylobacterium sp. PvR107]